MLRQRLHAHGGAARDLICVSLSLLLGWLLLLSQDCTNLQRENRQLSEQQAALQTQLQGEAWVLGSA